MTREYMDPDFIDWFHQEAMNFMMTHRLDFLNTFYKAYEEGFRTIVIDNESIFSGTPEEWGMFNAVQYIYEAYQENAKVWEKPRKKKTQPLDKDFEKEFIDYMNKKIRRKK